MAKIDGLVPWEALVAEIKPHYFKGKKGLPPKGIEKMLRVYFLQQRYGLANEALEDAIYDSQAMRLFAGIDLSTEGVLDATALLKFRLLLEDHDLTKAITATRIFSIVKSRNLNRSCSKFHRTVHTPKHNSSVSL